MVGERSRAPMFQALRRSVGTMSTPSTIRVGMRYLHGLVIVSRAHRAHNPPVPRDARDSRRGQFNFSPMISSNDGRRVSVINTDVTTTATCLLYTSPSPRD